MDNDESNSRLALLHENVKKYGTVFNTVACSAAALDALLLTPR